MAAHSFISIWVREEEGRDNNNEMTAHSSIIIWGFLYYYLGGVEGVGRGRGGGRTK